jgi:hypothetical protein
MEVTVEYERKTADAKVLKLPFFDPPRKRAMFEKAREPAKIAAVESIQR